MPKRFFLILGGVMLIIAGCAKRVPHAPPEAGVKPPTPVKASPVGIWQSTTRKGQTMVMQFKADGTVEFHNGLGFYNPAHWDYDPMRKILMLTMPYASDERMQIFQLWIGDGVKALDRERKQVTYDFTPQTDTLNVGGWLYTKAEAGAINVPAEPTLK